MAADFSRQALVECWCKAKIDVIVQETFVTDSTLKFFVNAAAAPIADITSYARMI